jgi:hypothetical protein
MNLLDEVLSGWMQLVKDSDRILLHPELLSEDELENVRLIRCGALKFLDGMEECASSATTKE